VIKKKMPPRQNVNSHVLLPLAQYSRSLKVLKKQGDYTTFWTKLLKSHIVTLLHIMDGNTPWKRYKVSYFPNPTSCFISTQNLEFSSSVENFHTERFLLSILFRERTKLF